MVKSCNYCFIRVSKTSQSAPITAWTRINSFVTKKKTILHLELYKGEIHRFTISDLWQEFRMDTFFISVINRTFKKLKKTTCVTAIYSRTLHKCVIQILINWFCIVHSVWSPYAKIAVITWINIVFREISSFQVPEQTTYGKMLFRDLKINFLQSGGFAVFYQREKTTNGKTKENLRRFEQCWKAYHNVEP